MDKSMDNAITNAPKGTYHHANRDWNLHLHRREIVEVIYLMALKLQISEFVIMLEEASGESVQRILFDVRHEYFEGNCWGSGRIL
jgi:hypothetical protein